MRLAGRLLVVALLAATWWGITHSPMVAACTLGIGAMRVIQERRESRLPFDGLLLMSVIVAVANLYLERL